MKLLKHFTIKNLVYFKPFILHQESVPPNFLKTLHLIRLEMLHLPREQNDLGHNERYNEDEKHFRMHYVMASMSLKLGYINERLFRCKKTNRVHGLVLFPPLFFFDRLKTKI